MIENANCKQREARVGARALRFAFPIVNESRNAQSPLNFSLLFSSRSWNYSIVYRPTRLLLT